MGIVIWYAGGVSRAETVNYSSVNFSFYVLAAAEDYLVVTTPLFDGGDTEQTPADQSHFLPINKPASLVKPIQQSDPVEKYIVMAKVISRD